MYQFSITIDKTKVQGTNTNFVYLFSELCSSIPSGFWSHVVDTVSGLDIRFFDTDEVTELKREIVIYNSGTSKVEAWVQIPSLGTTTNKIIYCKYGVSTKANDYDIWTSKGAQAVYHYQSDALDSTPNENDGTINGVTFVSGKTGNGALFERSNSDWINVPNDPTLVGMDSFAISAWIKINSKGSNGIPFACVWNNGPTKGMMAFGAWPGPTRRIFYISHTGLYQPAGDFTLATTLIDGVWYHLAWVKANGAVRNYINGVYEESPDFIGQLYNSDQPLRIGAPADFLWWDYFDGMIDELRIYNDTGVPDENYILTEYNNQNDPATFSSCGLETTDIIPVSIPTTFRVKNQPLKIILTNTRLYPYKIQDDNLMLKVDVVINNRISYLKDLPIGLQLNHTGVWDDYSDFTTNRFGSALIKYSTNTFSPVTNALARVKVLYNNKTYYSNAVRLNFLDTFIIIDAGYALNSRTGFDIFDGMQRVNTYTRE